MLAIMQLTSDISELIFMSEFLEIQYESIFIAKGLIIFYSTNIPTGDKG